MLSGPYPAPAPEIPLNRTAFPFVSFVGSGHALQERESKLRKELLEIEEKKQRIEERLKKKNGSVETVRDIRHDAKHVSTLAFPYNSGRSKPKAARRTRKFCRSPTRTSAHRTQRPMRR